MRTSGFQRFPVIVALLVLFVPAALFFIGCDDSNQREAAEEPEPLVSSRAYSGHESDMDANNFVNAFPVTVGTRLDDCQTCHRAGVTGTDTERVYNACDYCHLLEFPNPKYETGVPSGFYDTLNAFGAAYLTAGRSVDALAAIAGDDTDADGYSNAVEIENLRYPGDAGSRPDQPMAPMIVLTYDDLAAMPQHTQFMLMNTTKQQFDDYAMYQGVRLIDFLEAVDVDLTGVEGVTVYAPDGFGKDFSMAEIEMQYPEGTFYLTPDFPDPAMELVNYPPTMPDYVADGETIPDSLFMMIVLMRDGAPLDTAYYDGETGRLEGEGPYRQVIPQKEPGRPDRGLRSPEFNDGWDFVDDYDHNAGFCVRAACVIRLNPMPEGYEEYDWKQGWSLIENREIVVYGKGVTSR